MVGDQIEQAFRGPSAVEQGVCVHGKEEGDDLVVGEAVQPRQVVAIKRTNVNLWKRKLVQAQLSLSWLQNAHKQTLKSIV